MAKTTKPPAYSGQGKHLENAVLFIGCFVFLLLSLYLLGTYPIECDTARQYIAPTLIFATKPYRSARTKFSAANLSSVGNIKQKGRRAACNCNQQVR